MCFGNCARGLCSVSGLEKQKNERKKKKRKLKLGQQYSLYFLLIVPFGIYALIEDK